MTDDLRHPRCVAAILLDTIAHRSQSAHRRTPVVTDPPATNLVHTKRAGPSTFDRSIVEGPIARAVWRLAWPTVFQNMIGGLQGIVDHVMVGHYVGFTGNAAIGVGWQIFLVVVVFISSLYTGMGVLVARFAGANELERSTASSTRRF